MGERGGEVAELVSLNCPRGWNERAKQARFESSNARGRSTRQAKAIKGTRKRLPEGKREGAAWAVMW